MISLLTKHAVILQQKLDAKCHCPRKRDIAVLPIPTSPHYSQPQSNNSVLKQNLSLATDVRKKSFTGFKYRQWHSNHSLHHESYNKSFHFQYNARCCVPRRRSDKRSVGTYHTTKEQQNRNSAPMNCYGFSCIVASVHTRVAIKM